MDDLARWLGEQLDADERIARAATAGPWWADSSIHTESIYGSGNTAVVAGGRWDGEASVFESDEDAAHIVAHDPARVLREIDAKRDLLRFAKGIHDHHETFTTGVAARLEQTLRLFALAYADRPGYREEWAP